MAQIVGCFLMPHNPGLTSLAREMADPEQLEKVYGHFSEIGRKVRELRADTVIIIGDDHYTNFGPHCIPRYLIAIGDIDGPAENWLRIEKTRLTNNEPLAQHILAAGYAEGIDWAFAKTLTVEHAVIIPYHLALRDIPGLKVVPVYLNTIVAPPISNRRACEVGQSIARAVESWPGKDRIVVFGTGGLSHWVGTPETGLVNADFDRHLLDLCAAGDVEALVALSDETLLEEGGNGCLELKNWICAMATLPNGKGKTIGYEAMPELITGIGFAELTLTA